MRSMRASVGQQCRPDPVRLDHHHPTLHIPPIPALAVDRTDSCLRSASTSTAGALLHVATVSRICLPLLVPLSTVL